MNSFPSTSQTWQPEPRAMKPGDSRGYWSSPLAYVWQPPGIAFRARARSWSERSKRMRDPILDHRSRGTPAARHLADQGGDLAQRQRAGRRRGHDVDEHVERQAPVAQRGEREMDGPGRQPQQDAAQREAQRGGAQ